MSAASRRGGIATSSKPSVARLLGGIAVFFASALLGAGPAQAAASWPDARVASLVRDYGPAVVRIAVERAAMPMRRYSDRWREQARGLIPPEDDDAPSVGTGFVFGADGLIMTNAHVVVGGSQIRVTMPDRRGYEARLIGLDTVADIALLRIDATGLPTVRIGDPALTEVGESVVAIGSPYGFGNSVTAGIVSAKGRLLPGAEYMQFLQTDVPINPGNSGGPLFNLQGEVIGINSRIYSRSGGYQGLSFAIPIDVAMRITDQLLATGTVTRGRIGVSVQEVEQALADSFGLSRPAGALVSSVDPRSAAELGGLRSGDVILQVQGRDVIQAADALGLIAEQVPGALLRLVVWRDRAEQVIEVQVGGFDTPMLAPPVALPARMGFVVRPLARREQQMLRIEGGLLVQRVNAAAARAGVQPGDLILAINGQVVDTAEGLAQAFDMADGTVALLLQRGRARLFVPMCTRAGVMRC